MGLYVTSWEAHLCLPCYVDCLVVRQVHGHERAMMYGPIQPKGLMARGPGVGPGDPSSTEATPGPAFGDQLELFD